MFFVFDMFWWRIGYQYLLLFCPLLYFPFMNIEANKQALAHFRDMSTELKASSHCLIVIEQKRTNLSENMCQLIP